MTRENKLFSFLNGHLRDNFISHKMFNLVYYTWKEIDKKTNHEVYVPNCGVGPDGSVLFMWNLEEHHLEIEFDKEDNPPYLFYINRKDELAILGTDISISEISGEPLSKLLIFKKERMASKAILNSTS